MSEVLEMKELLERARIAIDNVMEKCELPKGRRVSFTDEEIVVRALKTYCETLETDWR